MNKKNKKIPKWIKITAAVFLVFILVSIFMSDNTDNNNTESENNSESIISTASETTEKEITIINLTAEKLISEFKENETTANNKYKGNRLIVSDAVVYSTKDNYVKLECTSNDYWINYIDAYYNSDQKNTVNALKKGEKVTVIGEYKGLSSWGDVKLWNCTFEQ